MRFLDRFPALRKAALRSPTVSACANLADSGRASDTEALVLAVAHLEDLQNATMAGLLAATETAAPPPIVVDDGRERLIAAERRAFKLGVQHATGGTCSADDDEADRVLARAEKKP